MRTSTAPPVVSPRGRPSALLNRILPEGARTDVVFARLALASVVVNLVIVVTGGAVRLSDSGLGCPTWPRCTDASLTPTSQSSAHGFIEFTNRMLTFVVVAVVVAVWLVAMARRQERTLATVAALSIPAQAVLGGFTVLTDLNPWLVGAHFLLSMAILAVTSWLWWRARGSSPAAPVAGAVRQLARATGGIAVAVLVLGTIVTGAGPHAGDTNTSGRVHRNGLHVSSMAQLHADTVMVLIGLTVGLLAVAHVVPTATALRRAVHILLAVELTQGVIGYTQYFLDVPPLLVGLHMLGAGLLWLAVLGVLARVEPLAVRAVG